jgi:hypothetical protein
VKNTSDNSENIKKQKYLQIVARKIFELPRLMRSLSNQSFWAGVAWWICQDRQPTGNIAKSKMQQTRSNRHSSNVNTNGQDDM